MTRLFRSNSRPGSTAFESSPPTPSLYLTNEDEDDEDDDEDDEDEECFANNNRISRSDGNRQQSPIVAIIVGVLRKSLVTCSVGRDDVSSMEIGWPTDVRHLSHVTFDRFNGFHGLPPEFQPQVPRKPPSASASVFGVSAKSMQCSYDQRGNSVPTILLMMQKRLYSEGGLKAEGVFRINAENSQEEYVRNQLNKGLVPYGIDVHCLAGLIKAWFRELPTGVLDSLTPDQVMHCNSEDQCTELVKLLPPTEGALLDWAINLMADVVRLEHHNKMNARNIAMVFAPNMTKMADPLTALIHAVQVMNLLKTLIVKTLREREESSAEEARSDPSCSESPSPCNMDEPLSSKINTGVSCEQTVDSSVHEGPPTDNFVRSDTLDRLEPDTEEKFWSIQKKSGEVEEEYESISGNSMPIKCDTGSLEHRSRGGDVNGPIEGILERLGWRKGVRKLCSHPVFQLSKPVKKTGGLGIVNNREGGGETCV